jgi:hypothetical protein
LGAYRGNDLIYIGNVGTGFTDQTAPTWNSSNRDLPKAKNHTADVLPYSERSRHLRETCGHAPGLVHEKQRSEEKVMMNRQ